LTIFFSLFEVLIYFKINKGVQERFDIIFGSMVMFRQRLTMKHFAEGLTENVSLNYFFMSSLQAFFYFLSACLLLLFFLF